MQSTSLTLLIFGVLSVLSHTAAIAQGPSDVQIAFFESKVRPLFANRCESCHGNKVQSAALNLVTAAGLPRVIAGKPESSLLIQAVSYEGRIKMPPSGKLPDPEIAVLREWANMGAPWPTSAKVDAPKRKEYTRAQKELWSLRQLKTPPMPALKNEAWVRNPIDRFLLARMDERALTPAPPASKLILIRRATFDLTGLPPTEPEISAFLNDNSSNAYANLIDRLLASPRYGERWGRHWLDVARYADSTGADEDIRYPHAWRYRDYVIDAFNHDLPYNQFVREQIAGDLLPDASGSPVNVKGIVATGFLALGPKLVAEQDKLKMFYDIVDEQIDVTGKAILGLTLACARCHDHKFDPISTADYYAMASIFASTKQLSKLEGTVSQLYYAPLVPADVADRYDSHQKKIEAVKAKIDAVAAEEGRRFREGLAPHLAAYMLAARQVYQDGASAAAISKDRSLDAAVLDRWVEYLKPTRERRVYLEPWYQAPSDKLEATALSYQKDFLAVSKERDDARAAWKVKADEAKARGEVPPEAPKFQPGDNRFFSEVTSGKGPFTLPEKDRDKVFSESARQKTAELKAEMQSLKDSSPPQPPLACGVAEGKNVDQHVFIRGNPESHGELVPKRFPVILAGANQPPISAGSGRKELAEWLVDSRNPLTSRVMVNRIWQGHFGEGLVRTPNNFGVAGERPSHPELLDWLAAEFIARGWSMKEMHRLIMLSNAYQMSSTEVSSESLEKDPDNRLLSHFSMRRLSVEEIRDTLLALDGSLETSMGGTLQKGEGTDKEFSDGRKSLHPDETKRRTVYLPIRRSNLASMLTLYDFGDATTSNEGRAQTNVAPQALFMMNSKFVNARAQALAAALAASEPDNERRVERAYSRVLGRTPEAAELQSALDYLGRFPAKPANEQSQLAWSTFCQALIASNDFIYVH